jgi:hypothetical protein
MQVAHANLIVPNGPRNRKTRDNFDLIQGCQIIITFPAILKERSNHIPLKNSIDCGGQKVLIPVEFDNQGDVVSDAVQSHAAVGAANIPGQQVRGGHGALTDRFNTVLVTQRNGFVVLHPKRSNER